MILVFMVPLRVAEHLLRSSRHRPHNAMVLAQSPTLQGRPERTRRRDPRASRRDNALGLKWLVMLNTLRPTRACRRRGSVTVFHTCMSSAKDRGKRPASFDRRTPAVRPHGRLLVYGHGFGRTVVAAWHPLAVMAVPDRRCRSGGRSASCASQPLCERCDQNPKRAPSMRVRGSSVAITRSNWDPFNRLKFVTGLLFSALNRSAISVNR